MNVLVSMITLGHMCLVTYFNLFYTRTYVNIQDEIVNERRKFQQNLTNA